MTEDDYCAYAEAFFAGKPEIYTRYYTDDVVLELSSLPPIRGAQAIADFYSAMFGTVRESLTVYAVEAGEEKLAVDCTSRFTAVEDASDFVVGALAKGEHVDVPMRVTYTLRDGLICHIGVRRAGDPVFSRAF